MSFATILYADGKEELINTNCKNINFLQCLRTKCAEVCGITDQLDVADENGECKFLFKNLDSYTSQYVGEREKLILLRVEDPKPGEKLANNCKFVPLLKSLEDDREFIVAINPLAGQKNSQKAKVSKVSMKKAMAANSSTSGGGNVTSNFASSSINNQSAMPQAAAGSKRASIVK